MALTKKRGIKKGINDHFCQLWTYYSRTYGYDVCIVVFYCKFCRIGLTADCCADTRDFVCS